jgi:hypothetical protein
LAASLRALFLKRDTIRAAKTAVCRQRPRPYVTRCHSLNGNCRPNYGTIPLRGRPCPAVRAYRPCQYIRCRVMKSEHYVHSASRESPVGRRRRGKLATRSDVAGAAGRWPTPARHSTQPRRRSGRTGLGRRLVQPAFSRARYLIHRGGKHRRKNNDQVNCCCWLCRSRLNFGASNNTSAGSSAGRHDHASSLGMRPV